MTIKKDLNSCSFFLIICAILSVSCSKPLATAKVAGDVEYKSRTYAASANDIYYAARWAIGEAGMSVATENLGDGIITTSWAPVTSSSHYMLVFDRPDYGVTNSYHQLEVQIAPDAGRTEVKVGSRVKTLVTNFKSSGVLEKKVLDGIGNYLRKSEPDVTNLGIDE